MHNTEKTYCTLIYVDIDTLPLKVFTPTIKKPHILHISSTSKVDHQASYSMQITKGTILRKFCFFAAPQEAPIRDINDIYFECCPGLITDDLWKYLPISSTNQRKHLSNIKNTDSTIIPSSCGKKNNQCKTMMTSKIN